ncbi:hypothetical protein D1007_02022 [Hordeum vulgare]|nr:hypothetical protein D1007_02022 [Hordeum vulgare]
MSILDIVSLKIYDIDDACVLYPPQSGERAECFAPILCVYAQDSIGYYLFTQESCNVRKGKDIAGVNEFVDDMRVVQEVHMKKEELFVEKEVTNAHNSEDDDESSNVDYDTGRM